MSDYRLIPLHGKNGRGKFAKVDPEDYEFLMKLGPWIASKDNGYVQYAYAHVTKKKTRLLAWHSRTYRMHRVILKPSKDKVVDHINHDGLDNRRSNLRICTQVDNMYNTRTLKKGRKYKGVHKNGSNWTSYITVNYVRTYLGYFYSERDAAIAYDVAASKHFGIYACLNFPEMTEAERADWKPVEKPHKVTSSKYQGVTLTKWGWQVAIRVKGKRHRLGYFDDEREAAHAYNMAALRLRGPDTFINPL